MNGRLNATVMRALDPDAMLARLRAIALALPGAEEARSHGTTAFRITRGRMFAWFFDDHHGDGRTKICVRTSGRDEQALLIEGDPATYSLPAYLGASGWIAMAALEDSDWAHLADRVARSWRMAAPDRRRAAV